MLTHIRKDESYIDCTWVLSITFTEGTCQYYLSKAMERDIASLSNIQAVYALNQREVISLILTEASVVAFHRAVAKQFSLWLTSSSQPPLTVVKGQLQKGTGHNNPNMKTFGPYHDDDDATNVGITYIQPETVNVVMSLGIEITGDDEAVLMVVFLPEDDSSYENGEKMRKEKGRSTMEWQDVA